MAPFWNLFMEQPSYDMIYDMISYNILHYITLYYINGLCTWLSFFQLIVSTDSLLLAASQTIVTLPKRKAFCDVGSRDITGLA